MKIFIHIVLTVHFFVLSNAAFAAPKPSQIIQILHTNDLHSHWNTTAQKNSGGYARVKSLMDKLEAEGNAKGWVTIRLDAGDFTEGHINYFANGGNGSFEIMKLMNYDAIALGNHDYLTRVTELERQVQEGRTLPLVAANFSWPNHKTNVEPGRVIVRGGLRIAVAGATTDEAYYIWAAKPAQISAPADPVRIWLSNQKADFKIALTHLGFDADKILVQSTSDIDLVVGGHSHTAIQKPFWLSSNLTKRLVPIVQTGAHGRYLGQTVVQLPNAARTRIISYKLIPVTLDLPEDQEVANVVASNRKIVAQTFNVNLDAVVAHSEDHFAAADIHTPVVGNFFADVLRETAQADIALDFGTLYGEGINKGDLTIEDVLMFQPHIYDWNNGGWHVMTAKISGKSLKTAMKIITLQKNPVYVSGMDVKMRKTRAFDYFNINGEIINEDKDYTVALSEGFLAGVKANPILQIFFKEPYVDTGVVYREALFNRTLQVNKFDALFFGKPRLIWPGSTKLIPLE